LRTTILGLKLAGGGARGSDTRTALRTCGKVGHCEKSFIVWRNTGSFKTSSPWTFTPCACSVRTTCALNPH
jgi:hypothetical protein